LKQDQNKNTSDRNLPYNYLNKLPLVCFREEDTHFSNQISRYHDVRPQLQDFAHRRVSIQQSAFSPAEANRILRADC